MTDLDLSTTTQNWEYLATQFKNDDIHNVIYAQIIQPLLDILNECDIPNAKHIYDIIEREFRNVQQFPLNLGHLGPGSILVRKVQRPLVLLTGNLRDLHTQVKTFDNSVCLCIPSNWL